MGLTGIPLIQRTTRPSVAGTRWHAEATSATTQLDINITIPSGDARKLIVLWGSDGGEFPTAVTFEPTGVAFPMIPIDGAFGEIGNLRIAAYYLDSPPVGAKVVRIETANAVWSVASLKVYQNARAGTPQSGVVQTTGTAASAVLSQTEEFLLDAFSETCDLILGSGLSDGQLTPFPGQTAGADDLVNASFLATTSDRTHRHNGDVLHGWDSASSADLLMAVVNVLFSTGQVAASAATLLSEWDLDETGTSYADAQGRSSAAVQSGLVSGGQSPLFSGGGASVSMQGALILAAHHVDWQVPSYSWAIYNQPRDWPASSNYSILSKDSGLPVPGGTQAEVETDGKIDWYIRDATGLTGTAIHVTSATGDGALTLDVAHLLVGTYDDETKTAKLYHRAAGGSVTLLASKTDANFTGLQNNSSPISMFSRYLASGNEFDGIGDRVQFYAGVLTQAEIEALPAPTTITDPDAPGAITAVADNVGAVPPSTTTDVDVLANDTGKTGPHYRITEVSDPAGRMSIINNDTATAKIRLTMPAAPSQTTNESGTYTVREGTSPTFGDPSNQAPVNWIREGTVGGGGYTPFPFVTVMNPSISHAGCASRPAFNANNPRSASFIDPMSGLEVFRVTGNVGSNVLLNGTTDTGLDFPKVLKPENAPRCQRTWNADGTLLSLPESKGRGGDPANPCRAAIIDADGSHGASNPWQIIRAFAAGSFDVPITGWFWDWNNPLRAYACHSDGLYEWFPIGAPGESVGAKHKLFNWPSGFSDWEAPRGGRAQSSHDGLIYFAPVRRNSDGFWGGIRVNLANGTFGPFVPNPAFTGGGGLANNDDDRGIMSTGALGTRGFFAFQDDHTLDFKFVNMITGAVGVFVNEAAVHGDYVHVDGREYLFGPRSGSWRLIDAITGAITPKADLTNGVIHASCRNFKDTFELVGATGGSTSGVRYGMACNSTPGSAAGVRGIRLGANDNNVVRYICNHRGVRTDNVSEIHPSPSPGFEYLAFNSNWQLPGIETDSSHVNTYVCLIPDAWRSPNNNGS